MHLKPDKLDHFRSYCATAVISIDEAMTHIVACSGDGRPSLQAVAILVAQSAIRTKAGCALRTLIASNWHTERVDGI